MDDPTIEDTVGTTRPFLFRFTLHVRQPEYETDQTPRVQRTLTPDPYG